MGVQITIKASGLNISANLKDESLPSLIQLVQENREDVPASSDMQVVPAATAAFSIQDNEAAVKERLRAFGAAELLNRLNWDTYPEKILLLAAWHESRGGDAPWRSADMDETFRQAKEKPPNNFPRDVKTAIKSGWIHAETPRTYVVTRTGWNKIGQTIQNLAQ
jgi:hypothetical protein